MLLKFFVYRLESKLLKSVNTDNIFSAIRDRSSLQQSQITELMETMNDQQQMFRPLADSTIDDFLADHHPATVQVLFQIVDHRFELLTIHQLLNSTPD